MTHTKHSARIDVIRSGQLWHVVVFGRVSRPHFPNNREVQPDPRDAEVDSYIFTTPDAPGEPALAPFELNDAEIEMAVDALVKEAEASEADVIEWDRIIGRTA